MALKNAISVEGQKEWPQQGSWGPQGSLWFTFYVPRHDRHALIIHDPGDRSRQKCIGKILWVVVLLLVKPAGCYFY
jgi:hypothetical protein